MNDFSQYKAAIKSAIAVVGFLFGAFNGFLIKFAPPDPTDELGFIIGVNKFIALALLLFISLLCNYQAIKKKPSQQKFVFLWLWVSGTLIIGFIVTSLFYYNNLKSKTIWQEDWKVSLIKGDSLTTDSKLICQEEQVKPGKDCEHYLLHNYYNADEITRQQLLWTDESVHRNTMILLINYILIVVCISGLLFSLVELLSWNIFKKAGGT